MQEPTHVTLNKYCPIEKKMIEFPAIVLGSVERPEHERLVLSVVYFKHNEPGTHHALTGVDWADTLERLMDVPHKDDLGNQAFFWVEEGGDLKKAVQDMSAGIGILRGQLAEKDSAIESLKQQLADLSEDEDQKAKKTSAKK